MLFGVREDTKETYGWPYLIYFYLTSSTSCRSFQMLSEAFGSVHNLSVWKQTKDVALWPVLIPAASVRVHECIGFVFNLKKILFTTETMNKHLKACNFCRRRKEREKNTWRTEVNEFSRIHARVQMPGWGVGAAWSEAFQVWLNISLWTELIHQSIHHQPEHICSPRSVHQLSRNWQVRQTA